jgi:hypothetical protein
VQIDPPGWLRWAPHVERLEALGPGPFAVGAEYLMAPKGRRASVWRVTAFDPPRSYTWASRVAPGLTLTARHVVEETAEGARVTLTLASTGVLAVLLGPLLAREFRASMQQEAEGLRAFCERSYP